MIDEEIIESEESKECEGGGERSEKQGIEEKWGESYSWRRKKLKVSEKKQNKIEKKSYVCGEFNWNERE